MSLKNLIFREREIETLHPHVLPDPQKGAPPNRSHTTYQSPWYMSTHTHARFSLGGKGPPWREIPATGDFLNISSSKGAASKAPSTDPLQREMLHPPKASFINLSKFPVDETYSRFPKRGPYEKRCSSPERFLHILRVPRKGALPGSLHRAPSESYTLPPEPLSTISQSPQ